MLRDAADHIQKLQGPTATLAGRRRGADHGRRGSRSLLNARVGMLRAMNYSVERVFRTDRKETHWGKRKLKRDE